MNNNETSRRTFLSRAGKTLIGSAALASLPVVTIAMNHQHGGGNGMTVDADAKDTCATCNFWGGMRKLSKDKKQVIAQSMGWCNNPDSPNHNKLTAADHKMQKTGIWKKWSVI